MRVIVTGCRDWTDKQAVFKELSELYWADDLTVLGDLTVVHGACKTGADAFAAEWCKVPSTNHRKVVEDPFPADWNEFGPMAGPMRNQEMADKGADLCLAFWDGRTHKSGTHDMIVRAVTAGIPVRIIPSRK